MKTLLRQVKAARRSWFILAHLWEYSHYTLGFVGIIATSLSNVLKTSNSSVADACAVLSVICVGYVTFFNPKQKADRQWRAYDYLNFACLEYEIAFEASEEFNQKGEMQRLIQAWKEATSFLKEESTVQEKASHSNDSKLGKE
jgi:hypothetical protein